MFKKMQKRIYCLLIACVLLTSSTFFATAIHAVSSDGIQGIMPFTTPCCLSQNITATGHMGNVTAAQSPTGVAIAGAPWEFCDACGTVTIEGGGAQTASMTLTQSRFPENIRPNILHITFTEPVIGGTILYDLFRGLPNLGGITNLHYLDTSHTQRFSRMFHSTPSVASGINLHLDLTSFNTENAVSMYAMFQDSAVVTVDTTGWDTSNITGLGARDGFTSTFWNASRLTTIYGINDWDLTNSQRLHRMFQGTVVLANLDPSNWNVTSNMVNLYHAFVGVGRDAAPVTQNWDLTSWDVSNVNNMSHVFRDMWNLTSLDVSGWDTSTATQMNSIFSQTRSLSRLDLGSWNLTGLSGIGNNNFNNGFWSIGINVGGFRELTLGPNWVWVTGTNANLPNPPSTVASGFYGDWVRVGAGTVHNPLDLIPALSSNDFVNQTQSNALRPTPAAGETYTWVWRPRVPQFAVTFVSGGNGTVAPAQTLVPIDNPPNTINSTSPGLAISTTPSANFQFSHWTSNQHAGNFTTDAIRDLPIEADTVFTAVFVPNTRTVTFELAGGTGTFPLQQVVDYGLLSTTPDPNPIRTGHNFLGWFTADGTQFNFDTPITEDITLYARWQRRSGGNNNVNNNVIIAPEDPPLGPFISDHIWYVRGFPDGEFKPGRSITRAEISMILFRLLDSANKYTPLSNNFSDVHDGWYAQAISYLASLGIVTGYPDGTFMPNAPITRAELTAVMSRFFELYENGTHSFSDVNNSLWAIDYINNSVNRGWIIGFEDNTFRPNNATTRAEAVTLINRVLDRVPNPKTIQDTLYLFIYEQFGIQRLFSDMTNSHWAYYQIMEAAVEHKFTRDAGNLEIWEDLYIPWLNN